MSPLTQPSAQYSLLLGLAALWLVNQRHVVCVSGTSGAMIVPCALLLLEPGGSPTVPWEGRYVYVVQCEQGSQLSREGGGVLSGVWVVVVFFFVVLISGRGNCCCSGIGLILGIWWVFRGYGLLLLLFFFVLISGGRKCCCWIMVWVWVFNGPLPSRKLVLVVLLLHHYYLHIYKRWSISCSLAVLILMI